MTDSDIRDNVKKAGGKVDGVLRFSIQWNDVERDDNDLDAHCIESFHNVEIFYARKISCFSGGNLDVDIIDPKYGTPAVENITFPVKSSMHSSKYHFFVRCFSNRGGKSGFRAEIEFDGKIYRYDYRKALRQNENVESDLSRVFSPKLSSEQTKKQKGLLFTAITSPQPVKEATLHRSEVASCSR